ncbi:HlyD family efflux transporter periplasmic adaptor subunit [Franconibacter helveticus 513]|uniref:HlyD family efflux transporter periplasmic adaptor subunit n=1 Tax=Franconibacter helveticus TaxID=357240 RepID=UPI0003FB0876|nr:HlyD family efflux transporter periplasmic adaptor subunit [Franconibacter helveticus]MDU6923367.1 HlyD family efflux transporter periplasmic adaptor subunit [Franconibacter helveticus]
MSKFMLYRKLRHERRSATRIIWACSLTLALFLVWAWFAVLDEVTLGSGKITPSSKAQVIQSLDGGIIDKVFVHEGQMVAQGELLARLDPVRFQSSFGEAAARARNLQASAERLRAELSGEPLRFSPEIAADAALVARERQLYESRRRNLEETVSHLQQSARLVEDELRMTEPLVAQGAAGRVEVIRLRKELSALQGKMDEARNDYAVRAREEQVKNNADLDAQRQIVEGKRDQLTRVTLHSPVRGIVKDIQLNTRGGVLSPGDKLMEIVPVEDRLLVETRISPRDIAWIRPGLAASVKITAYDPAIYGALPGEVEMVSADTLQDEVKRDLWFYRVYIRTQNAELTNKAGKRFPILPGMVADVEIKTGQKSVLDYLTKPLNKAREALRER